MSIKLIDKGSARLTYQGSVANKPTASETQLATARAITNGAGYIGEAGSILCDSVGGSALIENTHFAYNKRLDASVTEDVSEGFGTTSTGIYDTGTNGALASGKVFRIVENSLNIKNGAGLGLKIMAKYMPNIASIIPPPYNYCYVDPVNNTFSFPYPTYWSKFESAANITTNPEINILGLTPSISVGGAGGEFYGYGTGYGAKFGNALYLGCQLADYYYGGTITFKNAMTIPTGTISMYWGSAHGGDGSNAIHNSTLTINNFSIRSQYSYNGVGNGSYININGSDVTSGTVLAYNSVSHVFIVWDVNKGLTSGHSVRVYLNGNLHLSTSTTITDTGNLTLTTNNRAYGYQGVIWDNFKLWNYNNEAQLSAEYNSGTGRESALDLRYGGGTGVLAPSVGYIAKGSSTTPLTVTGSGDNHAATTEAVTLINAVGTFGAGGGVLNTDGFVTVPYEYNKRLDASTSEDATYGYGATAGGIWDTGNSGSLAANKYIRIVNNAVNVKSLTGITQIMAKNLASIQVPPANTIYVDPVLGKYVMPQPVYWSKCESIANLLAPEIGNILGAPSQNGNLGYLSTTVQKFNNGIIGYAGAQNIDSVLYPFGQSFTGLQAGTMSWWGMHWVYGGSGGHYSIFRIWCNATQWFGTIASSPSVWWNNVDGTTAIPNLQSTLKHIYVFWDWQNGLGDGSYMKVYVNNTLASTTNSTIICDRMALNWLGYDGYSYVYTDNIKIWDKVITDPTFEYNNGTGREAAFHPCYGLSNNYAPSSNTVGYYRSGWANNKIKLSI